MQLPSAVSSICWIQWIVRGIGSWSLLCDEQREREREREREKRERFVPVRSDLSHILPLPFLIRQFVAQADVMLQDKLWSSTVKLETVMMMMMKMMIPTHNFRFVCRVNHHCRAFFSLIVAFSSFFLSELCFANHQLMLISRHIRDWLAGWLALWMHTKQEVQRCFALTDTFC